MERQATVQVNFKLGDLKGQINNTVSGLGRGVGESTGIANDRRMKEQAEATKGLSQSMQDLAAVAVTSGLAMTGMVAAASPDALDTLWGSVKLLSGEIGMMLLPAVVEVSGWLQKGADWVRGMDEGTKGLIATLAVGAGTFAMAGFALQKIWSFGKMAFDGLKAAAMGARAFTAALGPLGWLALGVTAVATAIGLVASNMENLANSSEHAQQSLSQAESLQGAQGPVSSTTINQLSASDREQLASLSGEERERFIQTRIRELEDRQSQLNAGSVNISGVGGQLGEGLNPQARFARMQQYLGEVFSQALGSNFTQSPAMQSQINNASSSIAGISGSQGLGQTSLALQIFRNIQQFGASSGFGGGTGTMLASNFQSRQIGSAGSYYDAIAQRALSGSELNKRMEDLQETGNRTLEQIRDRLPPQPSPSV